MLTRLKRYVRHSLMRSSHADSFWLLPLWRRSRFAGSELAAAGHHGHFGRRHRCVLPIDHLSAPAQTADSNTPTVGAICCTRTDAELRELLQPSLADRISACEEPFRVWAARAWRTGARFDTVQWARKASFFTMGSMTFKEAYERTGRIFNVSGACERGRVPVWLAQSLTRAALTCRRLHRTVIPYDTHSPTKLLNYITAPDIVIYTAGEPQARAQCVPALLHRPRR